MNAIAEEIIGAVALQVEEFNAAVAALNNDRAVESAREILHLANAAKEHAGREDVSLSPEKLVSRRVEASVALEVAEIKLQRAERALQCRFDDVHPILQGAQKMTAQALRDAGLVFSEKIADGLRRVFGKYHARIQPKLAAELYQMRDEFEIAAREVERAVRPEDAAAGINRAFDLIENAYSPL